MKVIFLGTPEFAIPSLKAVMAAGHEVLAVVTPPDKAQDRGKQVKPCELKTFALKEGLKVLQYEKLSRDGTEDIRKLNPDIMITCSYGQILSQDLINIPKYGIINVHASLLPKYRGASPIQTAIIKGERETGITIMQTEAGLDTGDILLSKKTEIDENETAGELSKRLSEMGAEALINTLILIEKGKLLPRKQSHIQAEVTTRINKYEGAINWMKSAKSIKCQVLGQNPSPIAFTRTESGEKLKIYRANIAKQIDNTKEQPGTIIPPTSNKTGVFVQCGQGVLEITEAQFPNGKVLPAINLINGRKIYVGMRFVRTVFEAPQKNDFKK